MDRTACTEPQCLYKGPLYLYLSACTWVHFTLPQCLYKGALYLYLFTPLTTPSDRHCPILRPAADRYTERATDAAPKSSTQHLMEMAGIPYVAAALSAGKDSPITIGSEDSPRCLFLYFSAQFKSYAIKSLGNALCYGIVANWLFVVCHRLKKTK